MTAERIEAIIDETREIKVTADFTARFPYPFLVQEATRRSGPQNVERGTALLKKAPPTVGDGFAERDVWVRRVYPRGEGRDDDAVTVGRDAGCDLVFADGSISLLHARFSIDDGGAGADDDDEDEDEDEDEDDGTAFFVADAGSSNGTFLNGERIAADVRARVSDQDSIRFGPAVKVQFFTAAGFFQFLSAYRRIKKIRK